MKKKFGLTDDKVNEMKIHLATGEKDKFEPLKAYKAGKFKEWQEDQRKENFNRPYILSLIYMEPNKWLFAGIYEVLSVRPNGTHYMYETKITESSEAYFGKLFISYKRARAAYLLAENAIDEIEIIQILKNQFKPLASKIGK